MQNLSTSSNDPFSLSTPPTWMLMPFQSQFPCISHRSLFQSFFNRCGMQLSLHSTPNLVQVEYEEESSVPLPIMFQATGNFTPFQSVDPAASSIVRMWPFPNLSFAFIDLLLSSPPTRLCSPLYQMQDLGCVSPPLALRAHVPFPSFQTSVSLFAPLTRNKVINGSHEREVDHSSETEESDEGTVDTESISGKSDRFAEPTNLSPHPQITITTQGKYTKSSFSVAPTAIFSSNSCPSHSVASMASYFSKNEYSACLQLSTTAASMQNFFSRDKKDDSPAPNDNWHGLLSSPSQLLSSLSIPSPPIEKSASQNIPLSPPSVPSGVWMIDSASRGFLPSVYTPPVLLGFAYRKKDSGIHKAEIPSYEVSF